MDRPAGLPGGFFSTRGSRDVEEVLDGLVGQVELGAQQVKRGDNVALVVNDLVVDLGLSLRAQFVHNCGQQSGLVAGQLAARLKGGECSSEVISVLASLVGKRVNRAHLGCSGLVGRTSQRKPQRG